MRSIPPLVLIAALVAVPGLHAQPDTVREVASGVFFHEGDFRRGHCNNGWVIFEDYVLVIDANFAYQPSCAFDPRWACPLAPPENRLDVPGEAGERLA